MTAGRFQTLTQPLGEGRQTFRGFLQALARDPHARERWIQRLAEAPFAAFFWECPLLGPRQLERPFECVLVDCPPLAQIRTDGRPFAEHWSQPVHLDADPGPVAVPGLCQFHNPGGDALLLAPQPCRKRGNGWILDDPAMAHLAVFSRQADPARQSRFWALAAHCALNEASQRHLWLSTSGLGVSWLHVRLDQQPKYYSHLPYTLR